MTFSTDHSEDDTFKALTRVPFLKAWESIGWRSGKEEKAILEQIIRSNEDYDPPRYSEDGWHSVFEGWIWKDYVNACRKLYHERYGT